MAKCYFSGGFMPQNDNADDNADVKRSARSHASESSTSNFTYYSALSGGHGQNFQGTSMNIKNQLTSTYVDTKFNKLPVNNQHCMYNGDFNYTQYNNTSNRCEASESDSDSVADTDDDDNADDNIYNVEHKNKNLTHRVYKGKHENHNDYLTYDDDAEGERDEEQEEEEDISSTAGSIGSSINTFISADSVVSGSSARFAVAVNGKPPSYYNNKAQVASLIIPTNYNGHANCRNEMDDTNLCQQRMQYIPINNSDRDRYKIPNNVQYYKPDKYVEEDAAKMAASSKRNGTFLLPIKANGTETAVNFLTPNATEFKMPADKLSSVLGSANKRMMYKGNTNYYKQSDKCSDEGFSSRSESSFDDTIARNSTIINNKLSSGRSSNSSGLGEEYNDTIDKQNAPIFHLKEKFRKNSQKQNYDNVSVCDSGISSENLESKISSIYHSLPYSGDESTSRSNGISTVYGSIKSVEQPHINLVRAHKKDNRRLTPTGNTLKQINVNDDDLVKVLSNTESILSSRSDTLSTDTNISEMGSVATSGNTCFYSIPNSQSASNTARTFRSEGEHLKYIPMSIEKLDKTKSTGSLANRKTGEHENDSGEESTRSLSNSVNSSLATFYTANLSLASSIPHSDRSNSTASYKTCGMRTYYSALNYKPNTETESEDLESTDAEGDLKPPSNINAKKNVKKTVSFYKWFQQKKKQKEKNEMRQEKLEAARLKKAEEQKKISEMAVQNWMKKKQAEEMNKLQIIGNKQMENADVLKAEKNKKNLLDDERRKKLEEWEKKKKIQEEKQRATKKKQEERKKLAEIERREQSENAFKMWCTKSAGRPKPVPSSQGLDSLRGTMAPIFINKNEWVAA